MSSILRALKKLENEPRHRQENQGLDGKFVPLADTGPQKKPIGIVMMILGGGLICGLVVLTGWWLLTVKTPSAPIATQAVSRQNQQQEADPATEAEPAKQSVPESAAVSEIPPELPEAATDVKVPPERPESIPTQTSVTLPRPSSPIIEQRMVLPIAAQPVEPSGPTSEAQSAAAVKPDSAATVTAAATGPGQISAMKAEKIEIPLLNDPQMKLQAITWSKDPQKRIAVINNNILRQGEAVAGYRIDAINQDDVVLNAGGRKWKLLFRLR